MEQRMLLPDGVELWSFVELEARFICCQCCGDDEPDRTGCFKPSCPLGQADADIRQSTEEKIRIKLAAEREELMLAERYRESTRKRGRGHDLASGFGALSGTFGGM